MSPRETRGLVYPMDTYTYMVKKLVCSWIVDHLLIALAPQLDNLVDHCDIVELGGLQIRYRIGLWVSELTFGYRVYCVLSMTGGRRS